MSDNDKKEGQAPAPQNTPPEGSVKKVKKKHAFHMPNAYVIVFFALIIVIILTYFIPVSIHDPDTGEVVYNAALDADGNVIQNAGPQPSGLWDVLMAPILGFQNAAEVGIALLVAGGFLKVLNSTGGLEAGIGKMLKRLKGNMLVILMNLVCALMGTVFGFWEEILAFAIVVVPMFVLAGYDVMTGLAVMFVGASVGNMASVVNPFATGAAVAAINNPELTLGSGILLRGVIFVALYVVSTIMLVRYAAKVKANPDKSILAHVPGVKTSPDGSGEKKEMPEMTGKRAASLTVFILVVVILMIGYIPWGQIGGDKVAGIVNAPINFIASIPVVGDIFGAGHFTPLGEWGFNEFTWLFFTGSFVLMLINRMKVDDFLDSFIAGASDLLGVVFVLAISNGISIVMGDSTQGMSVTFVYWISSALAQVPLWIFAVFAVLAFVAIGLFLQSTSGVAGIAMPIMGAVASALFIGSAIGASGGQVILVSAFNIGLNFMCAIYPGAETLGTTQMYNVPFSAYFKFMMIHMVPLLLIGAIILSLAPYIGLAI